MNEREKVFLPRGSTRKSPRAGSEEDHQFSPTFTPVPLLYTICLDATNMEGYLPDIFHYFPKLTRLDLRNNNLTGILPKSLDRAEIEYLFLHNQKLGFEGSIHVLSTMTHLVDVQLQNNNFTGLIPDLSNSHYLTSLSLDNNFLTGVVPPSLANLQNMDYLTLDNNMLRGPIPNFSSNVEIISLYPINRLCPESDGHCDQMILLDIAQAFRNPVHLTHSWKWDNSNCQNWSFIMC
ncbi:hypothetical protein PIB30_021810 [Stylosanthes scabra]|uniref:Uncharacterized protein n=1 Tax=Stylosanthes scabra TaxID=79078 RepID=A0ABU6W6Z4_9FABA|nr:hypothetical protein [Stylosanthes scabra]